jgi:pimeloyl-ACP methyl ester carboxylesterase
MPFTRRPAAHPPAVDTVVDAGGVELSGLLAVPDGAPRGLVVAVHGTGMHAGYFHSASAPGLSLLDAGVARQFAVWAPDRPGYGVSAGLADECLGLTAQATTLLDSIDAVAATHGLTGRVLLVGHSYGVKVTLAMAAAPRGQRLLGLDGAGGGIKRALVRHSDATAWGPATLYPEGALARRRLPIHRVPPVQAAESATWPDDFRALAPSITIPLRLTFGTEDPFWPPNERHFAELRGLLINVPSLDIEVEPDTGHNISFGWSAARYHAKVLDFADACLRRDAHPRPG